MADMFSRGSAVDHITDDCRKDGRVTDVETTPNGVTLVTVTFPGEFGVWDQRALVDAVNAARWV